MNGGAKGVDKGILCGNTASRQIGAETAAEYGYTALNQLVEMEDSEETSGYAYYSGGLRKSKTADGSTHPDLGRVATGGGDFRRHRE